MPHHASIVAALSMIVPLAAQAPPEQWQVALGLQQRGLHDEAVTYFERFLREQPTHELAPEARYRLAISRIELGARDAAAKDLREALKTGGAGFRLRAECRYRLGNLLEAGGDHRGACQQFASLASEVGKDHYLLAAARFAEGEAWRDLGDDEKAMAAFAAAIDAATGERATFRFPSLYQLGFAQMRCQELADAAETFGAAAGCATDEAGKGECLFLKGDLHLQLRSPTAARAAFEAAAKCEGDFRDDAMLGIGFAALAVDDPQAARRAFQTVAERFPQTEVADRARLEIGRSMYTAGEHGPAAALLSPLCGEAVADDVRRQAVELLGLCALARGEGGDALPALQKALAAAAPSERPRLLFAIGEAHSNLQQWEEALAAYEQVPADAPPELLGEARYGACFALHSVGRHEESIVRAEEVRRLEPPHRLRAQATFAIAENRFALGQYPAAEKSYEALAAEPAFRERATWKLAWCAYLRGDKQAAAERFAAIAGTKGAASAEEALSMQALALWEAGQGDAALAAADTYRARHAEGKYLGRTERVAARVLRERGDLAGAQKRLERAAAVAAASGGADEAAVDRAEQAELAYQEGDYPAADKLFAQVAREPGPIGARGLAGRAWCAFELGDDGKCAARITKAKAHPESAGELAGLLELECALAHRRQAWPDAIAAASAFLQHFPQHEKRPAMTYALGTALSRGGDHAAAKKTLGELAAAGKYERLDRAYYELAWACRRGGDEAAALAAFAQVPRHGDDAELCGEARLHLGVAALEQKDAAAARTHLCAVQGSHRGQALYRLACHALEGAGTDVQQLAAARDRFAEIAAMPGEALTGEALYLGAECCRRLDDHRGAAERLQRLLAQEPKHTRADGARLLLGECAVRLGDGSAAVPPLEQFVRGKGREPADVARALLWLGRARVLRGEHTEAEASFAKVTELSEGPLAAEAQFRIGESRMQRGDLAAAADAFLKLPILYAHDEWVRRGLLQAGIAYERLNQPEKAKRFFRELIRDHAGSEEAKAARKHLGDV